ncbi:MAG: DedA family protein [Acidimicrobiales bacterium]
MDEHADPPPPVPEAPAPPERAPAADPPDAPAVAPQAEEGGARAEEEPEHPRLPRSKLILLVAPIAVLAVVGTITNALTPALAAKHPLLLILLEARNRNLVLAREVDFVPFLLVATFRRTLTDPLYYLLGRYYGDNAIRWLEVKAGMGSYARMMERIFSKASYPAVFFFPGAVVCALAGVIGMRFAVFFALNLSGTIFAVVVLKAFGEVVASPVEALIGFFDRNLVTTTIVSAVLVVLSVVLGRLEGKARLDLEELEGSEDGDAPAATGAEEPAREAE